MHMLVATDLSEPSLLSLEAVLGCDAALVERVTLLHVVDLDLYTAGGSIPQILEWAEETLSAQVERLRHMGLDAVHRVEQGPTVKTVTRIAQEVGAELVIVGSVGEGAGSGRRVGRTAERLALSAGVPVLVDVIEQREGSWCRIHEDAAFGRLLIAADLDDNLPRLLRRAAELPGREQVRIAHVLADSEAEETAAGSLTAAVSAADLAESEVCVLRGDPARRLLEEARAWRAGVIMVAPPDRGLLGRRLRFSGVAASILRAGEFSVLIA